MPHQNDQNARHEGNTHHAPDTAADEVLAEFEEAETRVGESDDSHQGQEGDALTTNEEAQEDTAKQKPGGSPGQRRTDPRA